MNDFDSLINERLYLFDFEVTRYDWLLVIHKYSDNSETIFHNSTADEVYDFIYNNDPIFLAHNGRYYDQYILKAILAGFTIDEIKKVNDHLIAGNQGFELNYGYIESMPAIWDTIQDVVPPRSLKEIEACLCMDVTESTIDFNIDHAWTNEEYKEMLYYCRHDVDALRPLFEARKSYFETKYDICILTDIDPVYNVGLTNAKLCAKFLEAEKIERDDEREYEIPENISINLIDKRVLNFFARIGDDTISDEDLFTSKLNIDLHGMPSVFAWGGAHGAIANFIYDKEKDEEIVINCDFASLYPHLLALPMYNFISRNIKDKFKYLNTLKRRLELKHLGKKKEQLGLKLILNTAYGCQNNKYNDLYDPKGARGTCITGQLLISELTERIYNIGEVSLVQLNTDGIMIKLPKYKLDEYYKVCEEFSKLCGIELEYDVISKIIQRDVNNYIMIYGEEGKEKIKAKGGCFGSLPDLKIEDGKIISKYEPNFKANSLAIVSEALARNLLYNTPVEETIKNCDNIFMFQVVSHLGSTYEKMVQESDKGDILLQRNNRVYAGKNPSGMLIKVKYDGRRDSLANCPSNPIVDNANQCSIVDIDKSWYIRLARQWINDFKGVKRLTEYKKEELLEKAIGLGLEVDKKMKKADIVKILVDYEDTLPVETLYPERIEVSKMEDKEVVTLNIYEKLNKIKAEIKEIDFVMDSVMPTNLGGREYPSVGQYYRAINDACMRHNVFFEWEVLKVSECQRELFKPTGKMPQHVWDVWCMAVFTNIDNPEEIVRTRSVASGSDMCDKGISGGSALAFRNWFDKNFTPKYLTDDDFDSGDTNATEEVKTSEPKIPTYIPPEKKEEIKKEVIATEQHEESDKDDIKEVIDNIMKVRELINNPEWGAVTLESLMNGNLQTADILAIKLKVDAKLESVSGE